MSVQYYIVVGLLVALLGIGCSTLNEGHPDPETEKCQACHSIPPKDKGQVLGNDPKLVGIHHTHLKSGLATCDICLKNNPLTCDMCHYGYNKVTDSWELPENHHAGAMRYDSSSCTKCHDYMNCNNPECHTTPSRDHKFKANMHDLHIKKVDPGSGEVSGYSCTYCHKGYDIENLTSPLDLPEWHNNKIKDDVIFDYPFPLDPLGTPSYNDGRCSNIYCHGTTLPGGKKVLTIADNVDTVGNAECNACHDTLLLATEVPVHAASEEHQENFKDCLNCHKNYLLKDGIVDNRTHINGKIDLFGCVNCHIEEMPSSYVMAEDGTVTRSQ